MILRMVEVVQRVAREVSFSAGILMPIMQEELRTQGGRRAVELDLDEGGGHIIGWAPPWVGWWGGSAPNS